MLQNLDLISIVFQVIAVLFAISVHEYAHGFISYRLGDPTPRLEGRLSLNPLAHLDPIGTLMLVVFRFGWAKPVMVNPTYYQNPRKGMMYVSLAGPGANVLTAYIFAFIRWVFVHFIIEWFPGMNFRTVVMLVYFLDLNIIINLGLAAFNLIPVPPLDGSKILGGLLPYRYRRVLYTLEQYGPIILVILLFTGIAGKIVSPIVRVLGYFIL
ncbi:MAG: site-2 protease family protein [Limnochordia bacterium]|nr:site-2 protease family protein [Limnochordia bacterium]MDD4518789.1 site-2 protease family protein [Limnochordia bacterium]